jgi:hypothetical protein
MLDDVYHIDIINLLLLHEIKCQFVGLVCYMPSYGCGKQYEKRIVASIINRSYIIHMTDHPLGERSYNSGVKPVIQ